MPATHTQAAQWTQQDWMNNVKRVKASGEGSVGVLFVWAGTSATETVDTNMPPQFVAKPVAASGASTRMAETVLKKVVSAASPDSIELKKGTAGHSGVMFWADKLRRDKDANMLNRYQAYADAGAILLQKNMGGFTEFSDAYKANPDALRSLLVDKMLMVNLGKLAAADLVLGNGDRVESANFGNIMFDRRTGQIAAIDSAAILGSYDQMLAASQAPDIHTFYGGYLNEEDRDDKTFVKMMATGGHIATPSDEQIQSLSQKGQGAQIAAPVLPPVAKLSPLENGRHGLLFDIMRGQLEGRIRKGLVVINPPSDFQWNIAKASFVMGFEEGLAACDKLLGGLTAYRLGFMKSSAWKELKKEYKEIGYNGEDPNLSWYNLTVRRDIYMQLRCGKTMEKAIAHATALAARKRGKMLDKKGNKVRTG